ncbi:MAG: hypothetical protein ACOC3X_01170 [Nanoarchaeota archaeon]
MKIKIEYINKLYKCKNIIHQGQISFGNYDQATYLGSCISLILFSSELKMGGLSHIVEHITNIGKYNFANEVIDKYLEIKKNYKLFDSKYYIVGGSSTCEHVFKNTKIELEKNNIKYKIIDVLGNYHRSICLIPKENTIKIFKKGFGKI